MTTDTAVGAGVDAIDATVAIETPTTEDAQAEPVSQPEPAAEDKPEDKTARNREARLQRRIGQLTAKNYQTAAERDELREKISQFEKGQQARTDDAPKEADFQTYGEFLDALTEYKADKLVNKKFTESTKKAQEQSRAVEDQQFREQRINHASENADKAKATFPDYTQVYNEYQDVLGSLPPDIERVLLEADNPSFAFYAMAKDGSIEQLAGMSPTRAAAAIALAEQRALLMKKPVTKAPAPLAAAKGTASGQKSLDQMTPDELKAWYSS